MCVFVFTINRVPAWQRVILLLNFSVSLATPQTLLSIILFVLFDVIQRIKQPIIRMFCVICYVLSCNYVTMPCYAFLFSYVISTDQKFL